MASNIIRVDLLTGKITKEDVPKEYLSLGGRGLTSTILSKEVDPKCDPLGPQNKLVIAPGLFGGTTIPSSGRISIGAKSPLTGGIKESNVGGITGQMLAKHDIKAIIIENCSNSAVKYLEISDDGIFLRDFDYDIYMGNYELTEVLQQKFNNELGILSVGPAGMRKMLSAAIAASDNEKKPTRHAARGGIGVVMGSKGLKAIVIHPSRKPSPKPTQTLKEAVKDFTKAIQANPAAQALHAFGTAVVVETACVLGSFPTHSFTRGSFDKWQNITGAKIVELQGQRNGKWSQRCMPGCAVACSNVFNDKDGNYVTSGLEYETLCLLGSNLDIDDIDTIAKLERACDDIGVDTIEVGGTIGVAMDEGKISYGDGDKVLGLIYEIGRGTKEGSLYGNGVVHIGKEIGAKRIPATMGQGHPAHDPRTFNGTGVTYCTSPMGADHTAGLVFNPEKKGAVELSRETQIHAMLCDTLGLCTFVSLPTEEILKIYNAFSNVEMSAEEIRKWALSLLRMEAGFNTKAGVPPIEERCSRIFREEKLPQSGNIFDTGYEEMKRIFD